MADGDGRVDEADEVDALWVQLGRCDGTRRADVLDELGGALVQRGRLGEAIEAVEAAKALYLAAGSPVDVARCDHNAGVILSDLEQEDEAIERYGEARALYEEHLRWGDAATSARSAADLLAARGRREEALEQLAAAARLHTDAEEPVRAALARLEAAELLLDDDRVAEAEELLQAARASLRVDGALLWVARTDQLLGDVARRAGRFDDAFARLEAARAVFDAADMDGDRDRCDDQWCAVLVDAGHADEAVTRLEQARSTRQSEGDPVGVAWCDLHLSRALDRLGDPEAAAQSRRRARAVFDAAGLDGVLTRRELQEAS